MLMTRAGNRTAKFESTTGALDSTATNITIYQWNNANELTEVSQYASYSATSRRVRLCSQVAYGYDAFGQIVSRTPAGGTAEYFVNDGQNVALVLNSGGQVFERELWGPGVDQILATEKVTPLSPGSVQSAGTVNWDLTDNQGTVRDVARVQRLDADDQRGRSPRLRLAWADLFAEQLRLSADVHVRRHVVRPDDWASISTRSLVRCRQRRLYQPGPGRLWPRAHEPEPSTAGTARRTPRTRAEWRSLNRLAPSSTAAPHSCLAQAGSITSAFLTNPSD